MRYYNVFVDTRNALYVYSDPDGSYAPGDRVKISFQGKTLSGWVVSLYKEIPDFKVLEIKEKMQNEITLTPEYMELLIWITDYYMCSFASVIKAALPMDLKIKYKTSYSISDEKLLQMNVLDPITDFFFKRMICTRSTLRANFNKKAIDEMIEKGLLIQKDKKIFPNIKAFFKNRNISNTAVDERMVFEYFKNKLQVSENLAKQKFGDNIKKLLRNKDLIKSTKISDDGIFTKNENLILDDHKYISDDEISLNDDQKRVRDSILSSPDKFFLIRGVTGSGKTEIYIELIKNALLKDKGCIFLVPEISLTPQLIVRTKKAFGEDIAILHSKMTAKERKDQWLRIYLGQTKVVLGVRSAIFAPVKDLEYIIMDEEHETTYKQDTNPRYHTRNVAIKRALLQGAKVIFGSATPSIESYYYAEIGQFRLLTLDNRYNGASMPDICITDMKKEENMYFSKELLSAMKDALIRGEQVILFLNRKGYATYIQCKDCGYVEECAHCSIKYIYYAKEKVYKCNYCGSTKPYTGKCSNCGSTNLIYSGKGVERIEEEIKKFFDVPIISVDSSIAKEKGFYKRAYEDFLSGKYKIMIGTQVVAKGLHFPNVTLVGVINADTILNFPDFRACEKTYQIITQVSGRSGRGDKKGKVIVQTYQPENRTFHYVMKGDYDGFYRSEIANRKAIKYPPFSKTINIGVTSLDETILDANARELKKDISDIALNGVEVYGPMRSLVYKVRDRYRNNIFIIGPREQMILFKRNLKKKLEKYDKIKNIMISVDVDPINMI